MASRAKAKTRKGTNGTGSSLTVYFDTTDPAERKALEAARLLAAKHGRRKQAIIALLEAVYDHYTDTGELMTTAQIISGLIGQSAPANRAPVGFAPAQTGQIVASDMTAEQRRASLQHADGAPDVIVTSGGKADAQTVADNFLKGFASAFFD